MNLTRLPWLLATLTLLFHAIGNPHYGFFRDELYFIICGRHPAWGYVDQPPLTPLLAAGSQLFGQSLFLLRLVPALCAAATVYIGCIFIVELGGGAFAQILLTVCVMLSPVLAVFGMKQSTDMLEMPLWPLAALFVLRAIDRAEPRWWLGAGLALGIAFNEKYSVIFFAAALLVGLLASSARTVVFNKWFSAGVLLAILIALPNLVWQVLHGLPMWELLRNGANGKNVVLSPLDYILQEFLITNPVLSLIWIAGLVWTLLLPARRWIAFTYVALIAVMILLHAKHYYPASIYPMMFACGAVAIEAWTQRAAWARIPVAISAMAFGALMVPLVMPVLPLATFMRYQAALDIAPPSTEHNKIRNLPQDYADMQGWPELAAAVASVYQSLPSKDRARAAIITNNYGEAAAIDFFGARYGLPPALSGHNQYFLWGPRGYDGSVVIRVPGDAADMNKYCSRSQIAAVFSNPNGMAYEDNLPIYVCYGVHPPLQILWPKTKEYN